ncbi:MAG TPA: VCBS repeat-containing protein, partial [Pyrinomonadaceae bacterium]|nr:VCBS repeat-containing protein [Pyrinomonadaceae bacterium]
SRQPTISTAERNELAGQFKFQQFILAEENVPLTKTIREVAPSLKHIAGWISSVGAGVALNDLDNDGLPNDVCKIDPRTDNVMIAPAPTTGERYKPFTLDAGNLFDRKTMAPTGCVPNDYNEDGLTDILVYFWGRTPIIFLAKTANLSADNYIAKEIVPTNERWFSGAATVADLDGDSHLDIVIGNYFQDGAEILDVNTTVRQSMQHSMSRALNGGKSRILRWTNAAKDSVNYEVVEDYIEAATDEEKRDLMHGWTLALAACDLDGDLLPELYFANDFGTDRLLYNRSKIGEIRFSPVVGKKGLTTPNSKIVGRDSFKGMGVDFADLNHDGKFDFFVSNIADDYALEESHLLFLSDENPEQLKQGIAPFKDHGEEFGVSRSSWGWDAKIADFNNDGENEIVQAVGFLKGETNRWAELHEVAMGNDQLLSNPQNWHRLESGDDLSGHDHNPFYVRAKDGRFYDISGELKINRSQITRGISTADVNGDGKLDFAIANQWDSSFFYLNQAQESNNFLGLRLRLPIANSNLSRPAIGAEVSVKMPNGQSSVSFIDGGNGHAGRRSSDVQFGLGKLANDANLSVLVRWRDEKGQIREQEFSLKSGWHTILLGKV